VLVGSPRLGDNLGLGRETGPFGRSPRCPAWAGWSPVAPGHRCRSNDRPWLSGGQNRSAASAPRNPRSLSFSFRPFSASLQATAMATMARRRGSLQRRRRAPHRRTSSPEAELAAVERPSERCPSQGAMRGVAAPLAASLPHAGERQRNHLSALRRFFLLTARRWW
jgi:hypothetical protein